MSLAEARVKAVEAKGQVEQGEDPGAAVRAKKEAKVEESRSTFAAVRDEFLVKYRGRQNRKSLDGVPLASQQRKSYTWI